MDLREIVRQRRSIRKYEKREIPRDILNEVLGGSQRGRAHEAAPGKVI